MTSHSDLIQKGSQQDWLPNHDKAVLQWRRGFPRHRYVIRTRSLSLVTMNSQYTYCLKSFPC